MVEPVARTTASKSAIELLGRHVLADGHAGDELDALGLQQLDAPVDDGLVQLHVRDAVHEQAADPVVALVDGHLVAGPVQLRRGGEAGRTAADDRDLEAGPGQRRLGDDPALHGRRAR
jgi:hypothetical protein